MTVQYQFATDGPCFINERPMTIPCYNPEGCIWPACPLECKWRPGKDPQYPLRDTWEEAASDAVKAGYAKWDNDAVLMLDVERGARIRNIKS